MQLFTFLSLVIALFGATFAVILTIGNVLIKFTEITKESSRIRKNEIEKSSTKNTQTVANISYKAFVYFSYAWYLTFLIPVSLFGIRIFTIIFDVCAEKNTEAIRAITNDNQGSLNTETLPDPNLLAWTDWEFCRTQLISLTRIFLWCIGASFVIFILVMGSAGLLKLVHYISASEKANKIEPVPEAKLPTEAEQ